MKKLKSTPLEIDDINDGISFSLEVFSEGNYNRDQLRTIVRNVGIKFDIRNHLSFSLSIDKILFIVKPESDNVQYFECSELQKELPYVLEQTSSISLFFFGHDLRSKLNEFENEKAQFKIEGRLNSKAVEFYSSDFVGEDLEKKVENLEDGELANWGGENYVTFDIQSF